MSDPTETSIKTWAKRIIDKTYAPIGVNLDEIRKIANEIAEISEIEKAKLDEAIGALEFIETEPPGCDSAWRAREALDKIHDGPGRTSKPDTPASGIAGSLLNDAYEVTRIPRELRGLTEAQFVEAVQKRMEAGIRLVYRGLGEAEKENYGKR
jgi:hypothetical protein